MPDLSRSERWTLWIADPAYGWHVHRGERFTEAMKVRTVEVMPVAEHEAVVNRLRKQVRELLKPPPRSLFTPEEDSVQLQKGK